MRNPEKRVTLTLTLYTVDFRGSKNVRTQMSWKIAGLTALLRFSTKKREREQNLNIGNRGEKSQTPTPTVAPTLILTPRRILTPTPTPVKSLSNFNILEMTDPDRVTRPHFCLQWGNVSQVGRSNLKRRGMEAMHPPAPSPPPPHLFGLTARLMDQLYMEITLS